MCPKFNEGICEVAGIEPQHVECANRLCFYLDSEYETCRLYIIENMLDDVKEGIL